MIARTRFLMMLCTAAGLSAVAGCGLAPSTTFAADSPPISGWVVFSSARDLWTMRSGSTERRQVTQTPKLVEGRASWSPDLGRLERR
jgi:hypothetical protein